MKEEIASARTDALAAALGRCVGDAGITGNLRVGGERVRAKAPNFTPPFEGRHLFIAHDAP